jgi:hypothetical protein
MMPAKHVRQDPIVKGVADTHLKLTFVPQAIIAQPQRATVQNSHAQEVHINHLSEALRRTTAPRAQLVSIVALEVVHLRLVSVAMSVHLQ